MNFMNSGNPINTIDTTNSSGFTLLEILIAIFIVAVILSTIYASYTGTLRVVEETESQAEIYRMARIAMERIIEDLESLYIRKSDKIPLLEGNTVHPDQFIGLDRDIKGRSADVLRFTSRAYIDLSGQGQDPGVSQIEYSVTEGEPADTLVLYRSDRPSFGSAFPLEEETDGVALCEGLLSVDFTYYDRKGQVYESWDTASDRFRHESPVMVSVSMEFAGGPEPEKSLSFMTSVALPVAKENL